MAAHLSDPPTDWPVDTIDLAGRRLIPGLIDGHVHFAGGGGEAGAATRVLPVQVSHLTLAGVTTAIGLLGTDTETRSMAELLANARGLAEFGLTTYCYTGGYQVPPKTLTGSVRGDLVHNDRIVAIGELAISDHRSSQPTLDELLRLASDAHVSGMITRKAGILHLHLGDGSRGLQLIEQALAQAELPARTYHPTHCNRNRRLWQQAKELSASGIYVDVTAFAADEDSLSAAQAMDDWLRTGLSPDRLTVSSDGGGCLPTFDNDGNLLHMDVGRSASLLEAVAELLAMGWRLDQVLPAFTSNVATLFRLPSKGRVAVGSDADLVVLGEDGTPWATLAGGHWLVREGKPLIRGLFEAQDF